MYEIVAFLGRMMTSRYGAVIDNAGWYCFGVLSALAFLMLMGALRVAKRGEVAKKDEEFAEAKRAVEEYCQKNGMPLPDGTIQEYWERKKFLGTLEELDKDHVVPARQTRAPVLLPSKQDKENDAQH